MDTTTEPTNAAILRGEQTAREILADLRALFARIQDTPGCHVTDALMEMAQDELPQLAGPWEWNVEGLGALAAGWWPGMDERSAGYERGPLGIGADTALLDLGSHARMVLRAGLAVADHRDRGLLLLCAAAMATRR